MLWARSQTALTSASYELHSGTMRTALTSLGSFVSGLLHCSRTTHRTAETMHQFLLLLERSLLHTHGSRYIGAV